MTFRPHLHVVSTESFVPPQHPHSSQEARCTSAPAMSIIDTGAGLTVVGMYCFHAHKISLMTWLVGLGATVSTQVIGRFKSDENTRLSCLIALATYETRSVNRSWHGSRCQEERLRLANTPEFTNSTQADPGLHPIDRWIIYLIKYGKLSCKLGSTLKSRTLTSSFMLRLPRKRCLETAILQDQF